METNRQIIKDYFNMVPGVTRQDAIQAAKNLGWNNLNQAEMMSQYYVGK